MKRSASEWKQLVSAWRRSGESAGEFAARESVSDRTLRWWAWKLERGTRAKRERTRPTPAPIEIALDRPRPRAEYVELVVGDVIVRAEVGTDPAYVALLVNRLAARS
jgi:transposase